MARRNARSPGSASPAAASPGSTAALRTANQQRVLDVLRGGPSARHTQAELARLTGLAPATVSNIVRELAGTGLVETEAGSGRRGSSVWISRSAGLVAGVDFGHSHVAVAVGDLTGEIIAEERQALEPTHAYDDSLKLAAALLTGLAAGHAPVLRVGMGVPAPISGGVVRAAGILPGWHNVDSLAAAEDAFGTPVDVENDANLGALAEHRQGVAQGHSSSVFVKLSSGVGAGIVLDGRIYHGASGTAGELGHLTLDEQGPPCRCGGRGCLEAYTSTANVLAMLSGQHPGADFDDVVALARDGDASSRRALEDAGLHLGWGLAGVVNLLNPDLVVVGGDMARAGELLLESARIGLRRHALDAVALTPVLASELGERASLVGAVLAAAERTQLAVG
ncbi:ROK family transcriptional regulator [Nocardioides sp.]|uniref:ROK family transcriptional regulator n=1 Tax=Nocardioides sp. TaxID=35761 RepID=UPI0039E5C72D